MVFGGGSTMIPFSLEDAVERKYCSTCELQGSCPIIIQVNKWRVKRDGKGADDEWGCTLHQEADDYSIETEEQE